MQDKVKKSMVSQFIGKALILMFFLFFSGCSGGDSRENSIKEFTLSGETQTDDGKAEEKAEDGSSESSTDKKTAAETTVFVYVCGAVKSPGVYELKSEARVFEAIRSAGGVTEEAVPDAVNQARVVTDGEQIYVPSVGEDVLQGTGVAEGKVTDSSENTKVNINTAGEDELMTLTGIGETKAAGIIEYREENGGFGSIEELMQVEGIKEGIFNKIKDDITI